MSLPALYELTNEYRSLSAITEDDELPPEVIRDTLEALTGDLEAKATNIAKLVLGLEMEAAMIEEAAEAMRQRAQRRKRRAEQIKAYTLFCLQSTGISKISCPEFTLAVRKNPEAVEIDEHADIPSEFMVQPEPPPLRPDKKALKEALKAGRKITGVWLKQTERLEIKV